MPGLEISLLCLLEVDDVPDGVKVLPTGVSIDVNGIL